MLAVERVLRVVRPVVVQGRKSFTVPDPRRVSGGACRDVRRGETSAVPVPSELSAGKRTSSRRQGHAGRQRDKCACTFIVARYKIRAPLMTLAAQLP